MDLLPAPLPPTPSASVPTRVAVLSVHTSPLDQPGEGDGGGLNVSVAETDFQDILQRAELSACVVSSERRHADSVLAAADRLVESEAEARIVRTEKVFY